ncbi:hypothetical protein MKW98_001537 [Papaver atlanticum]|uniref:Uncharacterized protein n=1 Tax=Papaver atlanticum TaxID=357466 RepID=A0AAD4X9R2_9MAGN|nr:hypothetical protein MKW98_001537 [Papaver atlanticum]
MNMERVDKSMGFFGIFKEAYNLTASKTKIFSQIFLAILLPLTILLLSQYLASYYILTDAYQTNDGETSRWILYSVTNFLCLIFILCLYLFSSATISYVVASHYTSKDITFKKAITVFPKVWGRLVVTFLWWFLVFVIYSVAASFLYVWFWASQDGAETETPRTKNNIVIISISIPYYAGLLYMTLIWRTATVLTVLEKDCGRKAMIKSIKLIWGKTLVSYAVCLVLAIAIYGIVYTFDQFVVNGKISSLTGRIFLGIACYLLMIVLLHFSLVIQAIIYFVCKSYHNEDIANVAQHLEGGPNAHIVGEKDVQLGPAALV